jgi:hypothetical protein
VKPAARATEALGRLGAFGKEIQTGYEAMADEGGQNLNIPVLGKYKVESVKGGLAGAKQVAGEALEAGSYFVGGLGAKTAVKGALKETVKQAVKRGAIEGAIAGGMGGTGVGLQREGSTAGDVVKSGLTGAVVGGAIGAAIPAVIGGSKKGIQKIQESFAASRKARFEELDMLATKQPDSRVVKYTLDGTKKMKDPVAKEAIKQGVPDADVALIKGSSATDKIKMRKMVDISERVQTNKRITDRATDVVGDTFLDQAKYIVKKNQEAAKSLNEVASKLGTKKVNISDKIDDFMLSLDEAGITLKGSGKKTQLVFKGSDFQDVPGAENALKKIFSRVQDLGTEPTAQNAHRLKIYIDNIVTYGKKTEGLPGYAEKLLKGLRHNIDEVLDTSIPAYNKANTIYSETISQINAINSAMGRKFNIAGPTANMRAGTILRRIQSNTQSRSELMQLLNDMQKTAQKYGMKVDEDIVTQSYFAQLLEDVFGSEAPTSLRGQMEGVARGAQEVGTIAENVKRGNIFGAVAQTGAKTINIARGINEKNKIKAIRALLELGEKGGGAGSVLGKPPVAPTAGGLASNAIKKTAIKSVAETAKLPNGVIIEPINKGANRVLSGTNPMKDPAMSGYIETIKDNPGKLNKFLQDIGWRIKSNFGKK